MKDNKYQELMSEIHVTDEMADRVLAGVEKAMAEEEGQTAEKKQETAGKDTAVDRKKDREPIQFKEKKKRRPWKRAGGLAAAACLVFLLGSYFGNSLLYSGRNYYADESAYTESEDGYAGTDEYYDESVESGDKDWVGEEEPAQTGGSQNSKGAKGADLPDTVAKDKLVYTCRVSLETKDYEKSRRALLDEVGRMKGYIESEDENAGGTETIGAEEERTGKSCTLVIRVPAADYDDFVEKMSDYGTVLSRNVETENISNTYGNTEVKIKALRIQEERLLKMMEKAESIQDMIAVEERLTEVQSELAWYEESLTGMDNQVDYATVTVSLREVKEYSESPEAGFGEKAGRQLKEGFGMLTAIGRNLVYVLLYLLPFLVTGGIIFAVILVVTRKIRS